MSSETYRILIVDDELPIQTLLDNFLSSLGHHCDMVSSGKEALKRLGESRFDVVITDVVMPEMDGITLTQEISRKYPNLPVMVMTGFSDEYSAEKAISAGARDFIKKPFSLNEFSLRLTKMMHDHKTLQAINAKKEEIEKISTQMISALQNESMEKIESLQREIEELNKKLSPSAGERTGQHSK